MAIDIVTITGGLPRDAELRFTPSGNAVTNFTVAQSDRKYNEQSQQWEGSKGVHVLHVQPCQCADGFPDAEGAEICLYFFP